MAVRSDGKTSESYASDSLGVDGEWGAFKTNASTTSSTSERRKIFINSTARNGGPGECVPRGESKRRVRRRAGDGARRWQKKGPACRRGGEVKTAVAPGRPKDDGRCCPRCRSAPPITVNKGALPHPLYIILMLCSVWIPTLLTICPTFGLFVLRPALLRFRAFIHLPTPILTL